MPYCDICGNPTGLNDRNFTEGGGALCDECLKQISGGGDAGDCVGENREAPVTKEPVRTSKKSMTEPMSFGQGQV